MPRLCIFLFFGLCMCQPGLAQVHYSLESGGVAGYATQTPFWLRARQHGIVPSDGSFATLRATFRKDYKNDTTHYKRRFEWGLGGMAVANFPIKTKHSPPQFLWPEGYAKLRWRWVELYAGRWHQVQGLGDSTLTSGFVAWSDNALPMPKVHLQTRGFVPLQWWGQFLAFNVGYAHGWFTVPYIKKAYLHQKYFYVRLGKPHHTLHFYTGLNHQVIWGGQADYLKGSDFAVNGQLPATWLDYVTVVTGRYPDALSSSRYTAFDGTNRIGNHLGSIDVALQYRLPNAQWLFYHQHLYEDASGLAFQNFPDGLTGLQFKNLRKGSVQLKSMVLEFLTTTHQSGRIFDPAARFQGADNYFNHGQYTEGWSYRGQSLGTPFLSPHFYLLADGIGFFPNNRVKVGHWGSSVGLSKNVSLTTLFSYSHNLGTFSHTFSPAIGQLSALLSAQITFSRWSGGVLTASYALDTGDLYPRVTGGYLSLKKNW
ncbi:MAG: capsule assembly Wzi family protein [Runella sp.]